MGDNTDTSPKNLAVRPTPTSTLSSSSNGLPTPSLLTPGTRAEAEFAFSSNADQQTDSAAPSTSPPINPVNAAALGGSLKATRRPLAPPRSGSSNYIAALAASPLALNDVAIQVQTFSPVTSGLAQIHKVDAEDLSVAKPAEGNVSYAEADLKRQRQLAMMGGTGAGHGYDSVQADEPK